MVDFKQHSDVVDLLGKAQGADDDMRDNAREVNYFLTARDGQWEPDVLERTKNRPRYTIDKCNPIVDAVMTQIEQFDFDIRVKPAGGDASKETAMIYDGLIRNIEALSNAQDIYVSGARKMTSMGIGGWRVVQKWASSDSFDQDLMIEPLSNFEDQVWFDPTAQRQDMSDAMYCFVLQAMGIDEYRQKFPNGTATSLSQNIDSQVYYDKAETVILGEFIYKKSTSIELVLMSNGNVYEVDENFEKVKDELAEQGITEEARRKRKSHKVVTRLMDGGGWLTGAQDTPFKSLPIIPCFGNFQISENKPVYWGVVDKLLDSQRIYNYAVSREIEEGALAPREKLMMTPEQAAGHQAQLRNMNISPDPVQFYNHQGDQPAPFKVAGPGVNPSLTTTANRAATDINSSAGQFAANLGDNPGLQSGAAIGLQIEQGNASNLKYIRSVEISVCQTAKVLIEAIPVVYDTKRQVRLLGEDGSVEIKTLNAPIYDQNTGEFVELIDLSKGTYDVTCKAMTGFKSRQDQAAKAIIELAQIAPEYLQRGADILLQNISAPGVDKLADRIRNDLVGAGQIPVEQMTEEEKVKFAQQQQAAAQAGPTPQQLLGQAEIQRAQAEVQEAQSRVRERELENQIKLINLEMANTEKAFKEQEFIAKTSLAAQNNQTNDSKARADAIQTQIKLALQEQNQDFQQEIQLSQRLSDAVAQLIENQKVLAESVQTVVSATGADAVIGPNALESMVQGFKQISDYQEAITPSLNQDVTVITGSGSDKNLENL